MRSRDRSAILLIILATALFIVRWPLNEYMCNPDTWKSSTGTPWRPPRGEGQTFFSSVFRGGGGTPAVLAMFGGQRYLIANILWSYSDILFHKGRPFDMVYALESAVTLNPTFTEAWSVYGWHMAWNLNSYVNDYVLKARYIAGGEEVYKRAVKANPSKPRPYFDLAWLYLTRIGDYEKAIEPLEHVVKNFKPITPEEQKRLRKLELNPLDSERRWDPKIVGHRLAYAYKKVGIVKSDWSYIEKSAETYRMCVKLDPTDKDAQANLAKIEANLHNDAWMAEQRRQESIVRRNFQMSPMEAFGTGDRHSHSGDEGDDHDH